jgi:hypothetical protein
MNHAGSGGSNIYNHLEQTLAITADESVKMSDARRRSEPP